MSISQDVVVSGVAIAVEPKVGLGGWMSFVMIGLFIDLLGCAIGVLVGGGGVQSILSVPPLIATVALLILAFQRKALFPKAYIAVRWGYVGLLVLLSVAEAAYGGDPASGMAEAIKATIGSFIWTLYMLKSVRVKNTFTEPLR